MLNITKCSFARELGQCNRKVFESTAEECFVRSNLVHKPFALPQTTKTTFFMAVSPDGNFIATAHGDHCVYVCDVLNGKVVHRLVGHPRSPWALAFHPSRSDLLASGCLGGEVRVWDLKTGCSEKLRLDEEDRFSRGSAAEASGNSNRATSVAIASVAFHPQTRLLAIAAGDRLIFWDWSNKYALAECRTASLRDRLRYVKFDHNGVLYTGITNSPNVTASGSANSETNSGNRSAMSSAQLEMMPIRCRELLTSRNEILQMRAELVRRHEQLLHRYNDLLVRFQELSDRYPDIRSTTTTSSLSRPLPAHRPLPVPPSPAAAAPASRLLDGRNSDEGFVSLMEENRRTGDEMETDNEQGDGRNQQLEPPSSPISLERLNEPEFYARDITQTSMQYFENRHNLSYERLCRSYRAMIESAERLITEFQRVYGDYISLREEVRRRTGTGEQSRGVQYEAGRAVLWALARMQEILRSGNASGIQIPPGLADGTPQHWTVEQRIYERVRREGRTLLLAHELLLNLRHRLDFQADFIDDLRRGHERLSRLVTELSRGDRSAPSASLETMHHRLVTEIQHFKLFICQWKHMVLSNMAILRGPHPSDLPTDSNNDAGFVPVRSPSETRGDEQSTSTHREPSQSDDAPSTSGQPQGRANYFQPSRKRPSSVDVGTSTESIVSVQSTATQVEQSTITLSTGTEIDDAAGVTTNQYPAERGSADENNGGAGQPAQDEVPMKRHRSSTDGETSAASSGQDNTNQHSQSEITDRSISTPSSEFNPSSMDTSNSSRSTAPNVEQQNTQGPERSNFVLYVPRESSRLSSTADIPPSQQENAPSASSDGSNSSNARFNRRRYALVGFPPRFERLPTASAHSQVIRLPFWARRAGDPPGEPPVENRDADDNTNNGNGDDWEYSYDLNRAVNRAIAGAFIGNGDAAIANNILDMTCRIQRWTVSLESERYPDLTQRDSNVVVANCKLHNDGSVSFNNTATMLAVFVENNPRDRCLLAHSALKIISLRPDDFGTVLYQKTFGPEAILVSFSPADGRHVLVGLASRKYLRLRHSPHTCGVIYTLSDSHRKGHQDGDACQPGDLKLALIVERKQRPNGVGLDAAGNWSAWGSRADTVNCATWLPTPGQGICYGTNRGQVFVLEPKGAEEPVEQCSDIRAPSLSSLTTEHWQASRWNLFGRQQAGNIDTDLPGARI